MQLKLLRAKIHRAVVTDANPEYIGSITIDKALMAAAGILTHEVVLVADVTNGARFETYVIEGPACSGAVCLNGAAAKLVNIGDKIIIMAFAYCSRREAQKLQPTVVHVDAGNRIVTACVADKDHECPE